MIFKRNIDKKQRLAIGFLTVGFLLVLTGTLFVFVNFYNIGNFIVNAGFLLTGAGVIFGLILLIKDNIRSRK